jgi:hypothetical protein
MPLTAKRQAEHRAGNVVDYKPVPRAKWLESALVAIKQTRNMLEHWLRELEKYVNDEYRLENQEDQDAAICERTRMVVVAGSALHSQTDLCKIETGWDSVELEWDLELARRTDAALQKAAEVTRNYGDDKAYKDNCGKRVLRVRKRWQLWCPEFANELEGPEAQTGP